MSHFPVLLETSGRGRCIVVHPRGKHPVELVRGNTSYEVTLPSQRVRIEDAEVIRRAPDLALLRAIAQLINLECIRPPLMIGPNTSMRIIGESGHRALTFFDGRNHRVWLETRVYAFGPHGPRWEGIINDPACGRISSRPFVYSNPLEAIVHTHVRHLCHSGSWP